ncbi:MAG: PfkB family carbohydrate kinase [Pseudomonadota bacterium]
MIHCFGSINLDHVHRVPRLPRPGETLADTGYARHLGGKGLNQALAAARAGASVRLSGAIGTGEAWLCAWLAGEGVITEGVAVLEDHATGHAVILVTPEGENAIVIHAGANRAIPERTLDAALAAARPGDWWLMQNETAPGPEAMARARARGLRTAYAAAPFEPEAVAAMLEHLDLLAVNQGEAAALTQTLGIGAEAVPMLLVTEGAEGARLHCAGETLHVAAVAVEAQDTTGAGDCFLGYLLAGLDTGLNATPALTRAAAAAALSVTREGAASAIPTAADVTAFLEARR